MDRGEGREAEGGAAWRAGNGGAEVHAIVTRGGMEKSMAGEGDKKNASRLVPAQDGLFALILWYVAKTLFRS